MSSSEQWLATGPENGSFTLSLLAALAIELSVLALLLPLMARPLPPARIQAPVRLTIEAPPTPKPPAPKPQPAQPKPPKPMVQPPPQPAKSLPLPVPPPPISRPAPHRARLVHHLPPPNVIPIQSPEPKPAPASPPAPAPPSAGQIDLFREAVRNAVQRAADGVFPDGTQIGGQAEITITYLNGRALSVSLTRGSGYPVLDAAALKAGRIAAYPAPPPAFANRVFPWTVTVIFEPAAPALDGD